MCGSANPKPPAKKAYKQVEEEREADHLHEVSDNLGLHKVRQSPYKLKV
jgi:hypothetical protein